MLDKAGSNKEALVALLNDIDENKRSIKAQLNRLFNERSEGVHKRNIRQIEISDTNEIVEFLIQAGEEVRIRLGEIKKDSKKLNVLKYERKLEYSLSFQEAAELVLDADILSQIKLKAQNIIEQRA